MKKISFVEQRDEARKLLNMVNQKQKQLKILNSVGRRLKELDSHQKANSKSSRRDEPNSLEASIARREFPDAIDDQTRMQIKLMVQSELEKSLATDGSSNREAGTLRNVQIGSRVYHREYGPGTVLYMGSTIKDDIPNGNRRMWYGIRLDAATGDSDGSMSHPASKATIVNYFQAKPNHATFCLREEMDISISGPRTKPLRTQTRTVPIEIRDIASGKLMWKMLVQDQMCRVVSLSDTQQRTKHTGNYAMKHLLESVIANIMEPAEQEKYLIEFWLLAYNDGERDDEVKRPLQWIRAPLQEPVLHCLTSRSLAAASTHIPSDLLLPESSHGWYHRNTVVGKDKTNDPVRPPISEIDLAQPRGLAAVYVRIIPNVSPLLSDEACDAQLHNKFTLKDPEKHRSARPYRMPSLAWCFQRKSSITMFQMWLSRPGLFEVIFAQLLKAQDAERTKERQILGIYDNMKPSTGLAYKSVQKVLIGFINEDNDAEDRRLALTLFNQAIRDSSSVSQVAGSTLQNASLAAMVDMDGFAFILREWCHIALGDDDVTQIDNSMVIMPMKAPASKKAQDDRTESEKKPDETRRSRIFVFLLRAFIFLISAVPLVLIFLGQSHTLSNVRERNNLIRWIDEGLLSRFEVGRAQGNFATEQRTEWLSLRDVDSWDDYFSWLLFNTRLQDLSLGSRIYEGSRDEKKGYSFQTVQIALSVKKWECEAANASPRMELVRCIIADTISKSVAKYYAKKKISINEKDYQESIVKTTSFSCQNQNAKTGEVTLTIEFQMPEHESAEFYWKSQKMYMCTALEANLRSPVVESPRVIKFGLFLKNNNLDLTYYCRKSEASVEEIEKSKKCPICFNFVKQFDSDAPLHVRCLCVCKLGFEGGTCERTSFCPVDCRYEVGVLTGSVAQQNCNCACKLGRKNPEREKSGFLKGCSIRIPCPKTCGPHAVKNVRKTNFITPGEDCCKPLNTAKDCAMRGLFLCPNYDLPGFINPLKNRCVRTCRDRKFEACDTVKVPTNYDTAAKKAFCNQYMEMAKEGQTYPCDYNKKNEHCMRRSQDGDMRTEMKEGKTCEDLALPRDLLKDLTPSQRLDMLCSYCHFYKDAHGHECFFDSLSQGEKCYTRKGSERSIQCEGANITAYGTDPAIHVEFCGGFGTNPREDIRPDVFNPFVESDVLCRYTVLPPSIESGWSREDSSISEDGEPLNACASCQYDNGDLRKPPENYIVPLSMGSAVAGNYIELKTNSGNENLLRQGRRVYMKAVDCRKFKLGANCAPCKPQPQQRCMAQDGHGFCVHGDCRAACDDCTTLDYWLVYLVSDTWGLVSGLRKGTKLDDAITAARKQGKLVGESTFSTKTSTRCPSDAINWHMLQDDKKIPKAKIVCGPPKSDKFDDVWATGFGSTDTDIKLTHGGFPAEIKFPKSLKKSDCTQSKLNGFCEVCAQAPYTFCRTKDGSGDETMGRCDSLGICAGVYSTVTDNAYVLELVSELGPQSEKYYWIFHEISLTSNKHLRAVSESVICATDPFDATWAASQKEVHYRCLPSEPNIWNLKAYEGCMLAEGSSACKAKGSKCTWQTEIFLELKIAANDLTRTCKRVLVAGLENEEPAAIWLCADEKCASDVCPDGSRRRQIGSRCCQCPTETPALLFSYVKKDSLWESGVWKLQLKDNNKNFVFSLSRKDIYRSKALTSFEQKLSPHLIHEWEESCGEKKCDRIPLKLKCAPTTYYCPATAVAAGKKAQGQCVDACDMSSSDDSCVGFTVTPFDGDSRVCALRPLCPQCHNGGISLGHGNDCKCACALGFQGKTCEDLIPCTNLCLNGGIRLGSVKNDDCKCICRQGFAGTHCETTLKCPTFCAEGNPRENTCGCLLEDCPNKCVNGAWSKNPDGSPVCMCSCQLGWKGLDCSKRVPCTNICLNGGVREGIVGLPNTCRCYCERTGFEGAACTRPVSLWNALERHDDLGQFVQQLQRPENAFYKDLLSDLTKSPSYKSMMVFGPLFYPVGGVEPSLHITPNGQRVGSSWINDKIYPTLGNYIKVSTRSTNLDHGGERLDVIFNRRVSLENLKGYISAANGVLHPINGYLGSNPCDFHSDRSEECLRCTSNTSACLRAACWYGFDRDQNRCYDKPWCQENVCASNGLKLLRTEKNELRPPLSVEDGATVGDVMKTIERQTSLKLTQSDVIVNGVELTNVSPQKTVFSLHHTRCDPQESNCNLIFVQLKLSRGNSQSECCAGAVSSCQGQSCPNLPLCAQDLCSAPDLVSRAEAGLRGASADHCCLCRATVNCGPSAIRLKQPVNGKCCLCGSNFPCPSSRALLMPFAVGRTPEECCTKKCPKCFLGSGKCQDTTQIPGVCKRPNPCTSNSCDSDSGAYYDRNKIKVHYVNEPAQLWDPFGTNPSACCSCALEVNCGWEGAERLEIPAEIARSQKTEYTCCQCGKFLCMSGVSKPRNTPALRFLEDCCLPQDGNSNRARRKLERRKLSGKITCGKWRKEEDGQCSSGKLFITTDTSKDIDTRDCYSDKDKKNEDSYCETTCCANSCKTDYQDRDCPAGQTLRSNPETKVCDNCFTTGYCCKTACSEWDGICPTPKEYKTPRAASPCDTDCDAAQCCRLICADWDNECPEGMQSQADETECTGDPCEEKDCCKWTCETWNGVCEKGKTRLQDPLQYCDSEACKTDCCKEYTCAEWGKDDKCADGDDTTRPGINKKRIAMWPELKCPGTLTDCNKEICCPSKCESVTGDLRGKFCETLLPGTKMDEKLNGNWCEQFQCNKDTYDDAVSCCLVDCTKTVFGANCANCEKEKNNLLECKVVSGQYGVCVEKKCVQVQKTCAADTVACSTDDFNGICSGTNACGVATCKNYQGNCPAGKISAEPTTECKEALIPAATTPPPAGTPAGTYILQDPHKMALAMCSKTTCCVDTAKCIEWDYDKNTKRCPPRQVKNPDGECPGDISKCTTTSCCARTCDSWLDECPTALNRLPDNTICASGKCNEKSCCKEQSTCGEWGRVCDRLTPPESPKPDTKCRGNCSAGVCCLSKCSTVEYRDKFCGVGKIYDSKLANNFCSSRECNQGLHDDVVSCCMVDCTDAAIGEVSACKNCGNNPTLDLLECKAAGDNVYGVCDGHNTCRKIVDIESENCQRDYQSCKKDTYKGLCLAGKCEPATCGNYPEVECENVENSVRAPPEEKCDEANFFISKMAVAMCNQNTCCKKRASCRYWSGDCDANEDKHPDRLCPGGASTCNAKECCTSTCEKFNCSTAPFSVQKAKADETEKLYCVLEKHFDEDSEFEKCSVLACCAEKYGIKDRYPYGKEKLRASSPPQLIRWRVANRTRKSCAYRMCKEDRNFLPWYGNTAWNTDSWQTTTNFTLLGHFANYPVEQIDAQDTLDLYSNSLEYYRCRIVSHLHDRSWWKAEDTAAIATVFGLQSDELKSMVACSFLVENDRLGSFRTSTHCAVLPIRKPRFFTHSCPTTKYAVGENNYFHFVGVVSALVCGAIYMLLSLLKCFVESPRACFRDLYWTYGVIIAIVGAAAFVLDMAYEQGIWKDIICKNEGFETKNKTWSANTYAHVWRLQVIHDGARILDWALCLVLVSASLHFLVRLLNECPGRDGQKPCHTYARIMIAFRDSASTLAFIGVFTIMFLGCVMHVARVLWGSQRNSFTTFGGAVTALLLLLLGGSPPDLYTNDSDTVLDKLAGLVLTTLMYVTSLILPAAVCATTVYYFFHPRRRDG